MISLLADIENILNTQSSVYLSVLESRYSCKVSIYKPVSDTHTSVYGRDSGEEGTIEYATIDAIVIGDEFTDVDGFSSGVIIAGTLYTSSNKLSDGDLISINRQDARSRRYKVHNLKNIGTTTNVFRKWSISAVGD